MLDRTTGELAVGDRGHERFYTASLAKLIVIVDVLDRRRTEGLKVTDADLQLFAAGARAERRQRDERAVGEVRRARAPARVSARLGLEGTAAPRRTGQWGEVEVTAADYATLWKYVLDDMPADGPRTADLGHGGRTVDREGRLRPGRSGLLSSDDPRRRVPGAVAKQGWMCCFSGQYYLHSAGVVGPEKRFVVVLLTRQPRTKGWPAARTEHDRDRDAGGRGAALTPGVVGGVCEPRRDDRRVRGRRQRRRIPAGLPVGPAGQRLLGRVLAGSGPSPVR